MDAVEVYTKLPDCDQRQLQTITARISAMAARNVWSVAEREWWRIIQEDNDVKLIMPGKNVRCVVDSSKYESINLQIIQLHWGIGWCVARCEWIESATHLWRGTHCPWPKAPMVCDRTLPSRMGSHRSRASYRSVTPNDHIQWSKEIALYIFRSRHMQAMLSHILDIWCGLVSKVREPRR